MNAFYFLRTDNSPKREKSFLIYAVVSQILMWPSIFCTTVSGLNSNIHLLLTDATHLSF